VIGRGIDLEHPAGTPDRHVPFAAHRIDKLALSARLQIFRPSRAGRAFGCGAAKEWGLNLASDLAAYRRGRLD
jgi:hypothetical protein